MASKKPMRDRDDLMAPRDPKKRYPAYNVQPQRPAKKAAGPRRAAGSAGPSKPSKPLQVSPVGQSTTGSWSRSKPKNIPSGYRLETAMTYPPKYRLVKNGSRRRGR